MDRAKEIDNKLFVAATLKDPVKVDLTNDEDAIAVEAIKKQLQFVADNFDKNDFLILNFSKNGDSQNRMVCSGVGPQAVEVILQMCDQFKIDPLILAISHTLRRMQHAKK